MFFIFYEYKQVIECVTRVFQFSEETDHSTNGSIIDNQFHLNTDVTAHSILFIKHSTPSSKLS